MRRPLIGPLVTALFSAAVLAGGAASPAAASPAPAPASERGAAAAGTAAQSQHVLPWTATAPAAQPAPPRPVAGKTPDFEGAVALSNCSGSVVRTPGARADDPALVLTNGHCLLGGMPGPGEVIVDQPSDRSFTLLEADASVAGTVHATKIAYATMTDTDIALYEVDASYEQIADKYGIEPLSLRTSHPKAGKDITVVSGYWKQTYGCALDGFVHRLKEADWTWKDSLRYTADCRTIGGTSGSPVIDNASGKVVGVNNTRNENGERCTLDNPCEVDRKGEVTVRPNIAYGQQTYMVAPCIAPGNAIDLTRKDCVLPRP